MTSRDYCFTSFALNLETLANFDKNHVTFLVGQLEVCPDSGREHIQGSIFFSRPMRVAAVKKTLKDETAHIEKRKGTKLQVGKPSANLGKSGVCQYGGKDSNLCPQCAHFLNPKGL